MHDGQAGAALQASPAARFANKRRQERDPGPGDMVGQSLVTCSPKDTFATVSCSMHVHCIESL